MPRVELRPPAPSYGGSGEGETPACSKRVHALRPTGSLCRESAWAVFKAANQITRFVDAKVSRPLYLFAHRTA